MPGPAAHAPDSITDSHSKAVHIGGLPYQADTVALINSWRVPESPKGDPSSLHPQLKWWLQEDHVLQGQPLHLLNMLCQSL